jgi:hypothetical protein
MACSRKRSSFDQAESAINTLPINVTAWRLTAAADTLR